MGGGETGGTGKWKINFRASNPLKLASYKYAYAFNVGGWRRVGCTGLAWKGERERESESETERDRITSQYLRAKCMEWLRATYINQTRVSRTGERERERVR